MVAKSADLRFLARQTARWPPQGDEVFDAGNTVKHKARRRCQPLNKDRIGRKIPKPVCLCADASDELAFLASRLRKPTGNSRSKNLSPPRSTTTPEPRSSRPGPPARAVTALRPRPFACATRSTASSSPHSRASFAAGRRARRATFGSPNRARSAERSAMNTRSCLPAPSPRSARLRR